MFLCVFMDEFVVFLDYLLLYLYVGVGVVLDDGLEVDIWDLIEFEFMCEVDVRMVNDNGDYNVLDVCEG